MKYCKKCKAIYSDDEQICPKCSRSLDITEDKNTPVYLLAAGGFELTRIRTALEDNGVPCDAVSQKRGLSADAVTGCDLSEYDLLVPFSAYEKAYDICVGIGAFKNDEAAVLNEKTEYDSGVKSAAEEFEDMSGVKRTAVRIVSAILLIMIFCAVIWGVDLLMQVFKNLF